MIGRLRRTAGRLARRFGPGRWPRPGPIRVHLAASVRNEGPYLLEWVAFHWLLGFDSITIYSNDNTDGSDLLLQAMQDHGLVAWVPLEVPQGASPQEMAFTSLTQRLFRDFRERGNYLAFLDLDEYLVLHRHENVRELVEHYGRPDALMVNWKHFGSDGQERYRDAPTIERFVRCSGGNRHDRFFKTLARIDPWQFLRLSGHRPFPIDPERPGMRILHAAPRRGSSAAGDDVRVSPDFVRGINPVGVDDAPVFHGVCQLNHYAIRTPEEFRCKTARRGGLLSPYSPDYFRQRDFRDETDTFARDKYLPGLKAYLDSLPPGILAIDRSIKQDFVARWRTAVG